MRVSIMGQAAFGEAVLKRLPIGRHRDRGRERPRAPAGARPDALWAAAGGAGLPLVATAALKAESGVSELARGRRRPLRHGVRHGDHPGPVLSVPRLGSIQYHPSLLPLHRGSSAMNWAIINGDTETGLRSSGPTRASIPGRALRKPLPIATGDTVGSHLLRPAVSDGRRCDRRGGSDGRRRHGAAHPPGPRPRHVRAAAGR